MQIALDYFVLTPADHNRKQLILLSLLCHPFCHFCPHEGHPLEVR